jgi:hypothetical protein
MFLKMAHSFIMGRTMPYDKNSELPETVRENLPEHGQGYLQGSLQQCVGAIQGPF